MADSPQQSDDGHRHLDRHTTWWTVLNSRTTVIVMFIAIQHGGQSSTVGRRSSSCSSPYNTADSPQQSSLSLSPYNSGVRKKARVQQSPEQTAMQWTPPHRNIPGNQEDYRLEKDGGELPQEQNEVTFEEAKTIVTEEKMASAALSLQQTGSRLRLRLRTGYCRLRHQMFTVFLVGHSPCVPVAHLQCGAHAAELSDPPEPPNRDLVC